MATAKQLPSGTWRIRVYDNELKKQVSFTSDTPGKAGKAEVELMAREYQLGKRQKKKHGKTVGECIDEYIGMKENILSPTTINEYRRCRRSDLADICDIYVSELTANDIQQLVNKLALRLQPKTVRNAHGLLVSVLNVCAPDLRIRTTLPQVQKKYKQLPPVEDVLRAVIGTDIELPCLLAMWCSLRMSEIRGLKKTDIKNGILTVQGATVTIGAVDIEKKSTKTVESTRRIKLPAYILGLVSKLPPEQEKITTMTRSAIYMQLSRLLEKNGIDHISFHDLRHMSASVMLALGIPDKYAMERGGWSTPSVMKSVYQHTFSAERQAADEKIDSYFESVLDSIFK